MTHRTWIPILVLVLLSPACPQDLGDDDEPGQDDDDADVDDGDDDTIDDDTTDDDTTDDDLVWCHPAAEIQVPADCAAIQAAIEAVDVGGTVYVSAGNYRENLDFLGKDVQVIAVDGVYATSIDPDSGCAVTFSGGETEAAALVGFTLIEGRGTEVSADGDHGHLAGGGVVVDGSSPTLRNLRVTHNCGGLLLRDASPTLWNVVVSGNYDGGGIHMHGSTAVLNNVRITENAHDGPGGGLFLEGSHVALVNAVVSENRARDYGAGVGAALGGGIYLGEDSSATLVNVAFLYNEAEADGGAIAVEDSTATLVNTTISESITEGQCGGLLVVDSTVTLRHSNVVEPWDWEQPYCGMADPTGQDGNLAVEPRFLNSVLCQEWDLHLQTISPLIDAGDPNLVDPDGSPSDIGPYGGEGAASWDLDRDGYYEWWLPGAYDPVTSPGLDCSDRDPDVFPGQGC